MELAENDCLEFYIVLVRENPDGRVPALTPRLFALREGDRINVGEKIAGHYTLDPVRPGDTVVFLGTGTGEAPHNYMTLELLEPGPHRQDPLRLLRPLPQATSATCDTHRDVMEQFPNYKYSPLTTREAGGTWQGVHPGPDHQRGAGGAARRPARPRRRRTSSCAATRR